MLHYIFTNSGHSLDADPATAAPHLHAVLRHVWHTCWNKAEGVDVACPTERFVLLSGLQSSGGVAVKRAHEITGVLAQLKHNMRLVAVYEIGSNGTAVETLRQWLVDGQMPTPFSYVFNMQRVASSIAMSAQEMPRVVWPSNGDRTVLTYAGTDILLGTKTVCAWAGGCGSGGAMEQCCLSGVVVTVC